MDFPRFPVSLTTIFPAANMKNGSQLLTERNLLTRETVANHSIIPYECGPSYTHSQDDFLINATKGEHVLYISGGMAIVHGHFVHLDSASNHAIAINLLDANRGAGSGSKLSGTLYIGLRAMYSNPTTLSASLDSGTEGSFYKGIQVVILPPSSFHLPEASDAKNSESGYTPEDQVTAHLFLGEIIYSESEGIRSVTPNKHRQECLDGDRISNLRDILDQTYVTKDGLDPHKLYIMAGKAKTETETGQWRDYWTDGTGSLIIWDSNPTLISSKDTVEDIWRRDEAVSASDNNPFVTESTFRYDPLDNRLKLVLPHKQVDGMKNSQGDTLYYRPNVINVPTANRATGAGGVLDRNWINFLNNLDDKIATMYRMPGGKMRQFIDVLTTRDDLPAPPIAYYDEKTRDASYYDSRLQYSFNLLQTQVAQLNDRFLDFQSKLESDWKEAVTQDVSAELTDKYNLTQSGLETLRSDVGTLQGDLASFQGDISSIASTIQESGSSLQAHLEAYQALADRVTTLESKWTSVTPAGEESQTQKNTDDISSIETQIQEIRNTVTTIQSDVNNKISAISSSVDTMSSTINGVYSKLYSRDGGNSGDVKDLSTAIEQLRSQYDYLYDAIHDLYDGINSEVQKATASLYNQLESALRKDIEAQIAALADQYNVTAEWSPGDYVLVAQDQTVVSENEDGTSYPSTMYVVVPGMTPLESKYVASYYDVYFTDLSTPVNRVFTEGVSNSNYNDAVDTYNQAVATVKRQVPPRFVYGYELGGNDVTELNSVDELPDIYNSTAMLDELYSSTALIEGVRGVPGKDYFVLRYRYPLTANNSDGNTYTDEITGDSYPDIQYKRYRWVSVFFTLNLVSDKVELDKDNPILLSGGTPYAMEDRVGGFLNVGSDVMGGGYVSRDDEGHLRLNDFELLAAGLSAYQLGEDRTEGAGLDISDLQDVFDQYVNERIAFPNETQIYRIIEKGLRSDEITVDINIGSTSEGILNIHDVDSRFNTAFHLNITGAATENVVLNITNCQRLRITMDQTSNPTIMLKNVCLFYDADIMDRVADIQGLTLWYEQLDEDQPKLEVDGMTVIYQGNLEPKGTYKFWTYTAGNDYSYAYALRQLTFASDGSIIGAGVAVTDNATINIENEPSIFASSFTLPQSIGLAYPATRLTKQIKITGTFATAYRTNDDGGGYIVKNTTFTMLTQKYLRYTGVKEWISGTISFFTQVTKVKGADGVDPNTLTQLGDEYAIDGWESGSYHIFYGGAVN